MRVPLTAILAALLLIDGVVVFRFLREGWPKRFVSEVAEGVLVSHPVPLAMTFADCVYLALYLLLHVVLCYGIWRLWRSRA